MDEIVFLSRKQVLEGGYEYPKDFITLIPTRHFWDRLEEREEGIPIIPTKVKVTPENIHSGKTKDGQTLHSVVIRLEYNMFRWIFLVLNPFDGGLKSVWFSDKKRYRNDSKAKVHREDSEQAVPNDRCEPNPQ